MATDDVGDAITNDVQKEVELALSRRIILFSEYVLLIKIMCLRRLMSERPLPNLPKVHSFFF